MAEPGESAPHPPKQPRQLSAAAEADRTEGNIAFFDKDYLRATQRYTRALCLAPWSASLYASRWVQAFWLQALRIPMQGSSTRALH